MRTARLLGVTLVALVAQVAACAPSATSGGDRPDVLTEVDLEMVQDYTVLEAIRQLRPRWLRGRGPSIGVDMAEGRSIVERGETLVRAYVDGVAQELGGLDLIHVQEVVRVRFLDATNATTRFGIDHEGGAILVTTRAG